MSPADSMLERDIQKSQKERINHPALGKYWLYELPVKGLHCPECAWDNKHKMFTAALDMEKTVLSLIPGAPLLTLEAFPFAAYKIYDAHSRMFINNNMQYTNFI